MNFPLPCLSSRVCSLLVVSVLCWAANASGQNDFLRLDSFGNVATSAATPWCVPWLDADGFLYGTTSEGGSTNDFGTVFKVNHDGSGFALLHQFLGGPGDGKKPQGGLIPGNDGALYGTTFSGGSNDVGTIFRITKDGSSYTVLKHLQGGAGGAGPQGQLLNGSDGLLYGTTSGTNGSTIFKLNTDGSGFAVLHVFGGTGDGQNPLAGVIEASNGTLYGTTSNGGTNNLGSIFALNKDGSSYVTLFSFAGTNGRNPQAGLLEASDGFLYGTTSYRSTNSYGTAFRLGKTADDFTVLRTFWGTNSEGWYPQAAFVEGNDGALYGTTTDGGLEGSGTVFKLNKDGSGYGVVHHFSRDNGDGQIPLTGFFKATNGLFYGTTSRGGSADYGSVFSFDPVTSNIVVVASFSWTGGDGWNPQANLMEASDGVLYGTTFNGGAGDFGTVFRMNKDRTGYAMLHSFDWHADGAFPQGGVIEATNGLLYGTTFEGGSNNFGTVFTLNKNGSNFSVLHHFSGTTGDGSHPQVGLLQGSDGALYGTTAQGGSKGWGTVFKFNQNGTGFTVLRSVPGTTTAEIEPMSALIEGSDGSLYGVAAGGVATSGAGSIFRLGKNGSTFVNLHSFTGSTNEGRGLAANLVEGTNGALYGTTFSGGTNGYGVIFKMNKDGSGFSVLRSFGNVFFDARNPAAGLVKDSNGWLYGTTFKSNPQNLLNTNGAVFKIDHDGNNFQVLQYFDAIPAGNNPVASLMQANDGALYGTASTGGDMGVGTIFSLGNPPAFTGLQFGDGGVELQFQGVFSRSYTLQATTNLAPALWQTLPGLAIWTNNQFHFLDAATTRVTAKFYRTLTQ